MAVPLDDRRLIARDANARIQSVDQLLEGGVDENDLDIVLALREIFTVYSFDKPIGEDIVAQPTLKAMIAAYKASHGEMDDMESIIECANAIHARTRIATPATLNAALYKAIAKYEAGGLDGLEEDDVDDMD